jgi:CBS domain-containing protein
VARLSVTQKASRLGASVRSAEEANPSLRRPHHGGPQFDRIPLGYEPTESFLPAGGALRVTNLRDIMTTGVGYLKTTDSVVDAAERLAQADIGAVPVCGPDGLWRAS